MGFDSHYSIDMGDAFKRTLALRSRTGLLQRAALCFALGRDSVNTQFSIPLHALCWESKSQHLAWVSWLCYEVGFHHMKHGSGKIVGWR